MPGYLFIHPLISALAGSLILLAYLTKARQKVFFAIHYLAGSLAVLVVVSTIGVASWAITQFLDASGQKLEFFNVFTPHRMAAMLVLVAMITQGVIGWLLYFYPAAPERVLLLHRWIAYSLVAMTVSAGLIGLVGLLTLVELLPGSFSLPLFILGAILGPTGMAGWLAWQKRQIQRSHKVRVVKFSSRSGLEANSQKPAIQYLPDGLHVETRPENTILQTSLAAGIPHTHVCGGNARCSTCRVMVVQGLEYCTPRNRREQGMADKLHFPENIRLACQTRITGPVTLRRLVLDEDDIEITSQIRRGARAGAVGEEKVMAIMFVDISQFTPFAESLPPYDVVHSLNRYYQRMGRVIQQYGGRIDNYMGDGLLAVFDFPNAHASAYQAVWAALDMLAAFDALKPYYQNTYNHGLDIRIGLHCGVAVTGQLGAENARRSSVIGDAVNLASRIEPVNKTLGTRLLISEDTLRYLEDAVEIGKQITLQLKGKQGDYTLYEVVGLK